jgi:4-amino-4-deoxy-L-arabinose transferase-like glycosyltransferase
VQSVERAASPTDRTAHRVWAAAALLLLAGYCLSRYRDALLSFFFLDDFWLLHDAAALQWHSPLDAIQLLRPTHVGFQLYRPLTQYAYFAALGASFGADASAYHAVQILAFTACALLVFGITRRLTGSIQAGLAAGLIYAATPGLAVAVFWMAAFTMLGTALVVFLMLWAWLCIDRPRRRVAACTVLQAIGLLASEHAVVGPALLALLAWYAPRGEPWQRRLRLLLAPAAVVAVYLLIKLWYFAAVQRPAGPYAPTANIGLWLMDAGHYALGAINLVKQHRPPAGPVSLLVGVLLVVLLAVATWRARRHNGRWRLLAVGVAVFLVAIVPVLALPWHAYDYFVGIAALGVALAVLGLCQVLGRRAWASLALAIALVLVLYDAVTGQAAARDDPAFRLILSGGAASARWIAGVRWVRAPRLQYVTVRSDPVTEAVFGMGHAELVFPGMPRRVELFPAHTRPPKSPGKVVLYRPVDTRALDRGLPGWDERWAWLRGLGR